MTVTTFSSTGTAASGPGHAHIAIVGAGPRGTSVVERLVAYAPDLITPGKQLTVHVIDPSSPGPGNVWRTNQSTELLMNTVTSQITLFTDKSVESAGRIVPGPTLYEWLKDSHPELGPDDYPTRALYGEYLTWVFNDVVARAPPNFHVEVHATRAVRLDDGLKGFQTLALEDGTTLTGLAAVVLAQGHLPLEADRDQRALAAYARQHRLTYIAPVNPADVDLSVLRAQEPVFLRGLGLCFFDYMALLTLGRGGRFERTRPAGNLTYIASGNEPRLYASSRRGIPFQARGDNEKGAFGRHYSILMTDEVIADFRRRAGRGDAPDFLKEVWPLIRKEVELIYYEALLRRTDFRDRFLAVPADSAEETRLLEQELGVKAEQRWSWERLGRPHAAHTFNSAAEWQEWLVGYLREDVKHASLGNVSGPLKAALDLLRDLRNEVRLIVDHAGLSGESRRAHLDRWYTPLNGYLSIGPPRERIEQMIALLEAGVLTLVGPSPEVVPGGSEHEDAWVARSPEIPGSAVRVTALIEARLPEPDLRSTGDALLARLQETGQCRPHVVDGYETGGLDVTHSPFHLIDCQGRAHPRRFALGVPTEGAHWVTAAGARPGVNSVTLCDTDAVAGAALLTAVSGLRGLSPEFRPMVQSESMMIQPIRL
ncbi:FAD-NAD(P)-binding-domain-containing protein [Apiospora marii]|uniref:FAD-NAD(P)-binding-domain-containing protein n=1 Tax=Apiospora marii TaxID=335849 RepID=A0ABR1SDG8_9PEZI